MVQVDCDTGCTDGANTRKAATAVVETARSVVVRRRFVSATGKRASVVNAATIVIVMRAVRRRTVIERSDAVRAVMVTQTVVQTMPMAPFV